MFQKNPGTELKLYFHLKEANDSTAGTNKNLRFMKFSFVTFS